MPDTCKPELVTAQLERILASPPLESSPSLCRFLRYVVEETLAGRSCCLKEYSLGVVAFERGENFDPRIDPIVRVQARNLRGRLGQYYAGPGANDPILIELPKRTYVPVFHCPRGREAGARGSLRLLRRSSLPLESWSRRPASRRRPPGAVQPG